MCSLPHQPSSAADKLSSNPRTYTSDTCGHVVKTQTYCRNTFIFCSLQNSFISIIQSKLRKNVLAWFKSYLELEQGLSLCLKSCWHVVGTTATPIKWDSLEKEKASRDGTSKLLPGIEQTAITNGYWSPNLCVALQRAGSYLPLKYI